MADTTSENLKRTALYDLHVEYGGKLVEFAGYEMPVQFPAGVKEEHLWTRSEAGLFDVSHMGPSFLTLAGGMRRDPDAHAEIAALVEMLVPSDIRNLKPGQARLTVLLNAEGGESAVGLFSGLRRAEVHGEPAAGSRRRDLHRVALRLYRRGRV